MLKALAGLLCLAGSACLIRAGKPGGPLHAPLGRRRTLGDLYTLLFVVMVTLGGALLVNVAAGWQPGDAAAVRAPALDGFSNFPVRMLA